MKFLVFELMVIVGLFHHLVENEGSSGSYRWKRAENEREERDGREKIEF